MGASDKLSAAEPLVGARASSEPTSSDTSRAGIPSSSSTPKQRWRATVACYTVSSSAKIVQRTWNLKCPASSHKHSPKQRTIQHITQPQNGRSKYNSVSCAFSIGNSTEGIESSTSLCFSGEILALRRYGSLRLGAVFMHPIGIGSPCTLSCRTPGLRSDTSLIRHCFTHCCHICLNGAIST